jgi:transposase
MAKRYVPTYEPMLSEEQWSKLAPLFPSPNVSPRGGQQPIDDRHCFEGILWMLRYGAAWKALPRGYPSASTCWRRLQDWADEDVLEEAWRTLLGELDERGRVVWEECFADATFIPAKKGATESAKPNGAKVRSWWWWRMARAYLWGSASSRPRLTNARSSKRRSTK